VLLETKSRHRAALLTVNMTEKFADFFFGSHLLLMLLLMLLKIKTLCCHRASTGGAFIFAELSICVRFCFKIGTNMFCGEHIPAHPRTPGWEDGGQNTSASREYSYKVPQPLPQIYFPLLNQAEWEGLQWPINCNHFYCLNASPPRIYSPAFLCHEHSKQLKSGSSLMLYQTLLHMHCLGTNALE